MLRNCPRQNTVRSNNQKLPGASTFNIELAPAPHESDIDDSVKVLDSLPVGLINFEIKEQYHLLPMLLYPLTEWHNHYSYWNEPNICPHQSIGDCYAMRADAILTLEQPYAGDEWYNFGFIRPELRFEVHKKPATGKYLIYDRLTKFQIFIKKFCLTNHRFNLARWFARQ